MTPIALSRALTRSLPALRLTGLALLGSLALAASAQIALPLWPVPATMQSFTVLLLGALGGSRIGAAAVLAYLVEGALGLPVFAGGASGLVALTGPTAGFLLGFLPAAWIAGHARGGALRQGLVLFLAHLALFVPGLLWLMPFTGAAGAVTAGLLPFIPGTVVKTGLAWTVLRALPGKSRR
ncbi:biotin transporter BioY [Pseudoroseomonas globiformis]|uniref:Biotin transporter n=1 Tax=Teichococcus globiformis TaxID=2307229 RepID=A0ABV7FZ96_9PROT